VQHAKSEGWLVQWDAHQVRFEKDGHQSVALSHLDAETVDLTRLRMLLDF
jgi:hypothetical protein